MKWTWQVKKTHRWQESQSGEIQSTFREAREVVLHCIAMTCGEGKKDRGSYVLQGRIKTQGKQLSRTEREKGQILDVGVKRENSMNSCKEL